MSVNILSTGTLYGVSITGGGGAQGVASTLGVSTGDFQSVKLGLQAAQLQQGGCNVFVGQSVVDLSSNGNNNSVLGYQAARSLAGDGNVVMGSLAASTLGPVGSSNVILGMGADVTAQSASGVVSVGARAAASGSSTALGTSAIASGNRSVALGYSTRASGVGSFTLANRIRGYYSGGSSTYAVHVDADVLKLANGGMLGFCNRTLTAVSSASSSDPLDQVPAWRFGLEGDDLVLRSVRGAVVRFVDDYRSSVLNFTGSHTVDWAAPEALVHALCSVPREVRDANIAACRHPLAYTLVQAVDEDDAAVECRAAEKTEDLESDCSLPRVEIWKRNGNAAAIFGAVAARQGGSEARRIGHVAFGEGKDKEKKSGITVHAAGDGKVWVRVRRCDGVMSIGTLLTGDPTIPGVACAQDEPRVVLSTTIAKTTQSLRFNSDSEYQLASCTYRM
jgi:hypothetical protein